jgi:hypothetical protein
MFDVLGELLYTAYSWTKRSRDNIKQLLHTVGIKSDIWRLLAETPQEC